MASEAIPHETKTYVRAAVRFQVLYMLNRAMAESGATAQRTASRLNCPERKVRRMLSGKAEMTLRDIGEMFWAIDGSMLDFRVDPKTDTSNAPRGID